MSENDQSQASAREPEHDERRDEGSRPLQQGERASGGRPQRGGERRPGGGGGGGGRGRGRHGQQQQSPQHGRRPEPSLNMDELRELADLFSAHGLTDFEFENEEIRVRLSRNAAPQGGGATTAPHGQATAIPTPTTPPAPHAPTHPATPSNATLPETTGAASPSSSAAPVEEKAEDLHIITSPIVGTFYRASSPTTEPFVRAGSHVEQDTVVCIIEAMKLMNEIQAETSGTVEKIYVENGQPVEYGQPLFGIKRQ
ncbi:MAG TPA: acetyl-CoA carboxylase biotin carboxyl carrier protein [Pyrinomonadaceae bacterium]|nr:acetyl-CoA carboxylase biotin carboxyl carrier protein [Pyrinomonadaceae bacterium]